MCFLTLPLRPSWMFPKVWLLFALFIAVGWPCWRDMPRRRAFAAIVVVAVISLFNARRQMRRYEDEPGRHFERVALRSGSLFASFPAVSRDGFFYQSMDHDRFVLRWLHGNQNEELSFEGQALQPRLAPNGSVDFELVANRSSMAMGFDPSTGDLSPDLGRSCRHSQNLDITQRKMDGR